VTQLGSLESVLVWLFLAYMLLTCGTYLLLNAFALRGLLLYLNQHRSLDEEVLYSGHEPPLTIIVPAFNEAATIVTSVQSLLQLVYSEFELVVVNDGSRDDTLSVLIEAFDLRPFPQANCVSWTRTMVESPTR
jgi:cellulose synthase/poly-beta-1,6-N-acetylglucosamine synthase-like glycosyltransferase